MSLAQCLSEEVGTGVYSNARREHVGTLSVIIIKQLRVGVFIVNYEMDGTRNDRSIRYDRF